MISINTLQEIIQSIYKAKFVHTLLFYHYYHFGKKYYKVLSNLANHQWLLHSDNCRGPRLRDSRVRTIIS